MKKFMKPESFGLSIKSLRNKNLNKNIINDVIHIP